MPGIYIMFNFPGQIEGIKMAAFTGQSDPARRAGHAAAPSLIPTIGVSWGEYPENELTKKMGVSFL